MITARKIRDAAIAIALAVPTIAMTRPVATHDVTPAAERSPMIAKAAIAGMTADEKRAALPMADNARR